MSGPGLIGARPIGIDRARVEALVVVAVFLALQAVALLTPELGVVDPEEGMTPVQAIVLGWIAPADLVLYQYRPFCGGCTLAALAYQPILAVLGDVVWGWKLVLVPFQLAWLVGGWRLADALGGRWARRSFQALACLPPWLVVAASWRGWTNHFEATAIAVLAASFLVGPRSRPWGGGALAGLAVYIGFSALPVVLAALVVVAVGRRWGDVARALAGGAWVVVPWAWIVLRTHDSPFALPHEARVDVWTRLFALFEPLRIAGTFGAPGLATGVALLAAIGAAVVVLARWGTGPARLSLVALLVWLAGWLLGGLDVDAVRTREPSQVLIEAARYGTVPAMIGLLAVATAVGRLAERGRPALAGALIALALVPGVVGRTSTLLRPGLTVDPLLHAHAASWDFFRVLWVGRGLDAPPWSCPAGDAACADLAAYRAAPPDALGAERLLASVRGDEVEADDAATAWAIGRAAVRLPLGPRTPPTEHGAAWALGYGQTWGARRGTVDRPEGYERWSTTMREAFERGVDEGASRPWWPRGE